MPEFVEVLLWIGGIGVATAAVGVGSVWYGVRRLTRSKGLRRRIEQGELNVRALSSDPTIREVAKHRLAMRRSSEATARALEAAKEARRPVGDLPQVAADLDRAYREMDDDLRVVENEPDAARRHRLLTDLLPDIRTHERLSGDLRRSLLHSRSGSTTSLQRAADDLMLEAQALSALGEGHERRIEPPEGRVRRPRRRDEDD